MKIFRYCRKVCLLLRKGRFFQIFQKIVSFIFPSRLVAMKKCYILRLDKSKRPTPRDRKDIETLRGDADLIVQGVHDLYDNRQSVLAYYEQLYKDGVEPFFARRNGRIVGELWVYTAFYEYAWEGSDKGRLNIEIEPTAKFFANGFVDPNARRQGISTMIAESIFEVYPESEFYTCIDESNDPSIISREKIGFRRCCAIYFLRLLKTTRCYFVPKNGKKRSLKLFYHSCIDVSLVER